MAIDTGKRTSDGVSYQLKQIKKNWDTSQIQKGGVAAKAGIFAKFAAQPTQAAPIKPTGTTAVVAGNRFVSGDPSAFARRKAAKDRAATKLQAFVRTKLAQTHYQYQLSNRRAAVGRKKKRLDEMEQMDRETAAAVRIQSLVRSALTRIEVCRMVERLIADLLGGDGAEGGGAAAGGAAAEPTGAAAAVGAGTAAASTGKTDASTPTLDPAAPTAATKQEEPQKLASKGVDTTGPTATTQKGAVTTGAATKAAVDATDSAGALDSEEAKQQAAVEAELEAQKKRIAKKEKALFVGPLQKQVGRIPAWWLEHTPHKVYHLDDFDESMEELWEMRYGSLKIHYIEVDEDAESVAVSLASEFSGSGGF